MRRRPSAGEIERKMQARMHADVELYGQTVIAVGPGPGANDRSFTYTVGRGTRGLPELLITLPVLPELAKGLLNNLDRLMPAALPSGSLVDVGGKFPVKLLDADDRAKERYTFGATRFHGGRDKYRVQLVLLCDRQGRFPPDCDEPFDQQPLLGQH